MANTSKGTRVGKQDQLIERNHREKRNRHKGAVLWLTGLSAAGKSTIAFTLEKKLFEKDIQCYVLDGDKVRKGLSSDLGFSQADRNENIRRLGEVSKLFMDAGFIVISAFISPYQKDRDRIRGIVDDGRFIEIFIDCPLEECEKRDPKGMYKKARTGELQEFTGVSAPYEAPKSPEIHLNTAQNSPDECIEKILNFLTSTNLV